MPRKNSKNGKAFKLPHIGQIVHVYTRNPNYWYNGCGVGPYPAVVTRVWSDKCINLKVMPDCGLPYDLTSTVRKEVEEQYNWWEPLPTGI
jgi:hypothetical protein